jgi:hypothetical protein
MRTQPEQTTVQPVWKWCAACESAFDFEKASWHTLDASLTECPLCGAPATEWMNWDEFRANHPEYPLEPDDHQFYPRQRE